MPQDKATCLYHKMETKKKYHKKADLSSKVGKYFLAKKKGMTKTEAAEVAGYKHPGVVMKQIEESVTYKAIEQKHYKDILLDKISLEEIAIKHAQNIRQNDNVNASNVAIQMSLDKIEPEDKDMTAPEVVVVNFK